MNISEAKQLIGKFLNGKSTLEEEQLLGDFLRQSESLPDELLPYKQMFAYFDHGMTDGRLLSGLDDVQTASKNNVGSKNGRKRNVMLIFAITTAAAVFLGMLYEISLPDIGMPNKQQYSGFVQDVNNLDTVDVKTDSLTPNGNKSNNYEIRQGKWRYRPAPFKPYIAESDECQNMDSINESAALMADHEIRKVEEEQKYIINLLNAIDIINTAEIASVADDEEVY